MEVGVAKSEKAELPKAEGETGAEDALKEVRARSRKPALSVRR